MSDITVQRKRVCLFVCLYYFQLLVSGFFPQPFHTILCDVLRNRWQATEYPWFPKNHCINSCLKFNQNLAVWAANKELFLRIPSIITELNFEILVITLQHPPLPWSALVPISLCGFSVLSFGKEHLISLASFRKETRLRAWQNRPLANPRSIRTVLILIQTYSGLTFYEVQHSSISKTRSIASWREVLKNMYNQQ